MVSAGVRNKQQSGPVRTSIPSRSLPFYLSPHNNQYLNIIMKTKLSGNCVALDKLFIGILAAGRWSRALVYFPPGPQFPLRFPIPHSQSHPRAHSWQIHATPTRRICHTWLSRSLTLTYLIRENLKGLVFRCRLRHLFQE